MLTQERLKKLVSYNPDTGIFIRLVDSKNYSMGDIAGHLHLTGYIIIGFNKMYYKAHRLAFLYMEGDMPEFVDHKDTVRYNNKWDNLRRATPRLNSYNQSIRSDNTTGIKGLSFRMTPAGKYKRWLGRVTYEGIRHGKEFYVDTYGDNAKELAIQWLEETRQQLHKEFTNHG